MNGLEEDEVVEGKDYSRPYFPRKTGEVGLYFDVDDAECEDSHAYGSEHLMRMEMNEKLAQHLASCDLVKVKSQLHTKGHFQGIVLEEVRRGTIIAVIMDNMSDLVAVWKLHKERQLSSLFQSLMVDADMLKAFGVRKLSLRVRVWQDELEACREEMRQMAKENERVDIRSRPRDVTIIQHVRQFQRDHSSAILLQLHDAEAKFDRHLSEFLLVVKQNLPQNLVTLPNLEYFQNLMTDILKSKPSGVEHVEEYFSTLELVRTALAQAEANIYLPLTSVPARCENEKQRELKKQMKSTLEEMMSLLEPKTSLAKACCKDWEAKILARERSVFMGLVSLIPLGVEKVTDIDDLLDEYVTSFPSLY